MELVFHGRPAGGQMHYDTAATFPGAARWNKTGTFQQGMLYVDNRGIAKLAGPASV
jgi:hypothetical protein